MAKNLVLGPILAPLVQICALKFFFLWILPSLYVKHCCKLLLYSISRKTKEPNLRKWKKKTNFGPDFGPFGQIWAAIFFFIFKNLASSVTRYHGQLLSCTISEKTDDSILKKT